MANWAPGLVNLRCRSTQLVIFPQSNSLVFGIRFAKASRPCGVIPGHGIRTQDARSVFKFRQSRRLNTEKVKANMRRQCLFQSVDNTVQVIWAS
jgi:hypothetical protein